MNKASRILLVLFCLVASGARVHAQGTPSNLVVKSNPEKVRLSWTAPGNDGGGDLDGFNVFMPVRVAYGGFTRTETILLLAEPGVPAGLIFELPVLDLGTRLRLGSIRVNSESARDSSPPAPSGLKHASDTLPHIETGYYFKESPSAATNCLQPRQISAGVELGSLAF